MCISPTLFRVFTNDRFKVLEAVGEGVVGRDSEVSGLLYADEFIGVPDISEGLQHLEAD